LTRNTSGGRGGDASKLDGPEDAGMDSFTPPVSDPSDPDKLRLGLAVSSTSGPASRCSSIWRLRGSLAGNDVGGRSWATSKVGGPEFDRVGTPWRNSQMRIST